MNTLPTLNGQNYAGEEIMLVRPAEPVYPSPLAVTYELNDLIHNLMDTLHDGANCRVTTLLARKALKAVDRATLHICEQSKKIALLEMDAMTDSLTGVLNRRGFEAELHRALSEGRRYKEQGALIYLDMDGFKTINDTLGHSAGDAMLCKFANILTDNVRDTDRVGRLGGDEFAVLMSRTSLENARVRAESIEWIINSSTFDWNDRPVSIQASLGTHYFGPDDDGPSVIQRADKAMYQHKQKRRKQPGIEFAVRDKVIPITSLIGQAG